MAVESEAVPLLAGPLIAGKQIEAAEALRRARWIKTEREIGLLRTASKLADIGHTTLDRLCDEAGPERDRHVVRDFEPDLSWKPGREIPLTRRAGDRAAHDGGALSQRAAQPDHRSRRRRADGPERPVPRLLVRLHQYARHRRTPDLGREALCQSVAGRLRGGDGRAASRARRRATRRMPPKPPSPDIGLPMAHYAGHQIGVTVNELPRLVPYDHSLIEPGMVFSVEPGAYQGKGGTFGARSEKMVLVTASGPEILSTFEWGI